MFDKNSTLVQIWINLIKNGDMKIYDVPNLFNLKSIIEEIMNTAETES